MYTPPTVEFRAGENGPKSNNVNFARNAAQGIANDTMTPVSIFQVVNGRNQGVLGSPIYPELKLVD